MLPLRGMGRTNPGTRFSERGSRTQGSALTFCLMHTQSRAHRIWGRRLSRSTKPVSSSDLRTRVRRFYAYQSASSFAIWIPFWALWIRGHLSTDLEFTFVDVAFWIGLLVFQLPVGVIADRIPRRRTIIVSELFRSAGILGYGISATFWGYVGANVVWSIGAAFSIGTSAYLYEALLEAGHESEFPRYIGRVTMIQLLSNAAGSSGWSGTSASRCWSAPSSIWWRSPSRSRSASRRSSGRPNRRMSSNSSRACGSYAGGRASPC